MTLALNKPLSAEHQVTLATRKHSTLANAEKVADRQPLRHGGVVRCWIRPKTSACT